MLMFGKLNFSSVLDTFRQCDLSYIERQIGDRRETNIDFFWLKISFLSTLGHLAKPSLTTEIYEEVFSWM